MGTLVGCSRMGC